MRTVQVQQADGAEVGDARDRLQNPEPLAGAQPRRFRGVRRRLQAKAAVCRGSRGWRPPAAADVCVALPVLQRRDGPLTTALALRGLGPCTLGPAARGHLANPRSHDQTPHLDGPVGKQEVQDHAQRPERRLDPPGGGHLMASRTGVKVGQSSFRWVPTKRCFPGDRAITALRARATCSAAPRKSARSSRKHKVDCSTTTQA